MTLSIVFMESTTNEMNKKQKGGKINEIKKEIKFAKNCLNEN